MWVLFVDSGKPDGLPDKLAGRNTGMKITTLNDANANFGIIPQAAMADLKGKGNTGYGYVQCVLVAVFSGLVCHCIGE